MTENELTALFDGFDSSLYESEVKERWGETGAYEESTRRTRGYTQQDWKRYKAESDTIMTDAANLLRSNVSAESDEAIAVAERHRQSIDRWFYPCGASMHVRLAEMYEADARFTRNIDAYGPGLTTWLAAAIRANAVR